MAMRDVNRLYKFYDELRDIHMTYFPDWRFGQMVVNVLSEWQSREDRDIFYLEEDEILQIFKDYKDYINNMK